MLKQLVNSLMNTIIEVNVVNNEGYDKVMELINMFKSCDNVEINERGFYSNIWFMVSNRDAKSVKKILGKLDSVISYK